MHFPQNWHPTYCSWWLFNRYGRRAIFLPTTKKTVFEVRHWISV